MQGTSVYKQVMSDARQRVTVVANFAEVWLAKLKLNARAEPVYGERDVVDLEKMREPVRTSEGRTVYRCSAEPVDAYVAKGGDIADAESRRRLCNGLTADSGQAQFRPETNEEEIPLVTSGDVLLLLEQFAATRPGYTASEVIRYPCP